MNFYQLYRYTISVLAQKNRKIKPLDFNKKIWYFKNAGFKSAMILNEK